MPERTSDKRTVHGATTPLDLGFSCYGFDGAGRVLVAQHARLKRAFPPARPDEVETWQWWSWQHLQGEAAAPDSIFSPWARLQVPFLAAFEQVAVTAGVEHR